MISGLLFKILGVFGLVSIILGVTLRKKKQEDLAFIVGGILLCVYSAYLKDPIFILLQVIFTAVAIFDYFRKRTHKTYETGGV